MQQYGRWRKPFKHVRVVKIALNATYIDTLTVNLHLKICNLLTKKVWNLIVAICICYAHVSLHKRALEWTHSSRTVWEIYRNTHKLYPSSPGPRAWGQGLAYSLLVHADKMNSLIGLHKTSSLFSRMCYVNVSLQKKCWNGPITSVQCEESTATLNNFIIQVLNYERGVMNWHVQSTCTQIKWTLSLDSKKQFIVFFHLNLLCDIYMCVGMDP